MALYAVGLFLALACGDAALGTCVLVLAATMGDIPVGRKSGCKIKIKPGVFRRTLRRVGGQIIVLALVLLDIGSLGLALAAPVWVATWVTMNLTVLVLSALSWSEEKRIQSESATAMQRQQRNLEECQREAQREQEVEGLAQAEQQPREAEHNQRQEEDKREAQRQQQAEHVERLRQAEQLLREAEQRRRQEERGARRKHQRERTPAGAQFQADWWIVLGVAPSASKDEIVRKYRHSIKQYHPDRVVGLAPELLQLAEERTKALNEAYENAMRTRWRGAA